LTNVPSGLVSSSGQVDHDQTTNYDANEHFTQANITTVGTVTTGDVSAILPTGTVSSSAQVDYTGLTNVPSGIVSSSGQVDHDQTINYSADEHFTQANITTVGTVTSGDVSAILPTGTVSSSTQVDYDSIQNVPSGIVSSSGQVDYAGLSNIPSGIVSSSTQVDYNSIQNVPSGILSASSFTSPSQGTVRATINGVQTDVDTGLQTGDSPQFTNLTLSGDLTVNGTTTYISSSQVDIGDQIITLNANNAAGDGGIYVNDTSTNETGSLLWDVSENYWIGGLLGSESELITLTSLNAKGVVSSSGQVDYTGLSNVPSGIVSSSTQVDYDSIQNVPSGIVSSSTQVDYTGLSNIPAGIVSSSQQINTGSFSGSFIGDGSGLTGLVSASHALNADDAVSSSYAITSSYSETSEWSGLNNIPSGLVSSSGQVDYDSIQNVPSGIVSSSGQVDYTGLSNIPSGIVSSSQQINTGSFSGSFSGDGSGLTGVTGVGSGVEIRDDGAIQGTAQILDFVDGIDATFASSTASISLNRTGSFTGSFSGDGSGLTSLTADTATSADTASYLNPLQQLVRITGSVDVAQGNLVLDDNAYFLYGTNTSDTSVSLIGVNGSDIVEIGNQGFNINMVDDVIIDGFVSASSYISASTFSGDGAGLTGLVSSSYALTASYSNTSEWSGLNNIPSGLVSSSGQVDYTSISNVPSGIVSSSGQVDYTGLSNIPSGIVSSSTQFNTFSGSFTGSFVGDGVGLTGLVSSSYALTASYAANGGGGGGVTINNNTDNYLVTATGTADTLDGEQNLQFDGSRLTVTGDISASGDVSGSRLHIRGRNSDEFLGLFVSGNVTPEAPAHGNPGNTLSVQGDNQACFHGRDVTNNIDFLFGTSTNGVVFAGSMTGHDLELRRDGVTKLTIKSTEISSSNVPVTASGFWGDGSQVTGVVSSSYAVTASHALNGGGGVTINNNVDTYLVTATGTADTLDGESKLTFDGTTFNVDGAFTAQTKSFLIDHQSLPGKKLIYGVLEGPEHAVYLRGRLTNDDTITFPEEWSWLVDKDSITVQLTPIGSHQQLWVEQVTETSITVNSNTDIDCYYLVHATRKDVDAPQTVE
jgi:hypothetical protein